MYWRGSCSLIILYEEKRNNYVTKVIEQLHGHFLTSSGPNVKAIIFAGCAEFKEILFNRQDLDPRIKTIVIGIIEVAYGSENGLNQAIENSRNLITDSRLLQETAVLLKFFKEIELGSNMVAYGRKAVMAALEAGASKILLISDKLEEDTLVETYAKYGTELEIVSDSSSEGTQFLKGFGGLGAILRYPYEFVDDTVEEELGGDFDDFEDFI